MINDNLKKYKYEWYKHGWWHISDTHRLVEIGQNVIGLFAIACNY